MATLSTQEDAADELWQARDLYVKVWERYSHREGVAYANDAYKHVRKALAHIETDALSGEDQALVEWIEATAKALAADERDLDACRDVMDVIEFHLYHVLNGRDPERHPAVEEVLAEEIDN